MPFGEYVANVLPDVESVGEADDVVDIDMDVEAVGTTVTERMKSAADEADGDTDTLGVVPADALVVGVENQRK